MTYDTLQEARNDWEHGLEAKALQKPVEDTAIVLTEEEDTEAEERYGVIRYFKTTGTTDVKWRVSVDKSDVDLEEAFEEAVDQLARLLKQQD